MVTGHSITLIGLDGSTTYYFRAKTIDAGFAQSDWTSEYSVYTDTGPAAVTTLSALNDSAEATINLSWLAPGENGTNGNLTGEYRIQHSTYNTDWSPAMAQITISMRRSISN